MILGPKSWLHTVAEESGEGNTPGNFANAPHHVGDEGAGLYFVRMREEKHGG